VQRRANVPAIHGRNPEGIQLLLSLHRRHYFIQMLTGEVRASTPNNFQANSGLRDPAQPQKKFRAAEVTFLAYRISSKSEKPLPERIANLQACPLPHIIRQLSRFLRMLKYYRRFPPDAAAIQTPLHPLLDGPSNGIANHQLDNRAQPILRGVQG